MAFEESSTRSGGESRPDIPAPAGGPAAPDSPAVAETRPARPARPQGAPGMGSIFVLAFLVILIPGLVAYSLLRWCGLAIGPAGLLGLLVIIVGLGFFPAVLQRLGWVRRRRGRPARNRRA